MVLSPQKGFSLLEALIVISLIGIVALIVIPDLIAMLFDYRLTLATREVSTAIHLARSRSVADNFRYTFSLNPSDSTYTVTGGEQDTNMDGNLDPWEDRNNNGILDTNSFQRERLPSGINYVADLSTLASPIPGLSDTAPSTPVDYGDVSASSVSFTPLGAANVTSVFYFRNNRNATSAISIDSAGRVQAWRYSDGAWRRR